MTRKEVKKIREAYDKITEELECKAFPLLKNGKVPYRFIEEDIKLRNVENSMELSTIMRSGKLSRLVECMKDTGVSFEFDFNYEYESICFPCVPDNEEHESVIFVFDKSGQFVDLLVNNKPIDMSDRKRRHNVPDDINKKIIRNCLNVINIYYECNQDNIGDTEKDILNSIINGAEDLSKKMGLLQFVEWIDKLTNHKHLDGTLQYIKRHNIS